MDILNLAKDAGMQVILDGRIGGEEYRSEYGSVHALQRFADALRASVADETDHPGTRAQISEQLGNCEA
jgi:hypothetical protein